MRSSDKKIGRMANGSSSTASVIRTALRLKTKSVDG